MHPSLPAAWMLGSLRRFLEFFWVSAVSFYTVHLLRFLFSYTTCTTIHFLFHLFRFLELHRFDF